MAVLVAAIFSSASNLLVNCSNFVYGYCSCASTLSWRVCSVRATAASNFELIKYEKFPSEEVSFFVDKSLRSFFNFFLLMFLDIVIRVLSALISVSMDDLVLLNKSLRSCRLYLKSCMSSR